MNKFMKKLMKKDGFTLVELIVVIAILAILAGVAVPAYSGYIAKANDSAIETELTAISTAAMAAEAVSGELETISVSKDGITVTITGVNAANFADDFETFYGVKPQKDTDTTYTVTLTPSNAWKGSTYAEENGAKWTPTTGWDVIKN